MVLARAWRLARETVTEWNGDHATTRAAALAYYTVFSIAPMIIIAVAIAGVVFGERAARGEVERQIEGLVGTAGARVIQDLVDNAARPGRGLWAALLGVAVLVFGATAAFSELQQSLNALWKVEPRKSSTSFLRSRLLSFVMVVLSGLLLAASLVASAALSAIEEWMREHARDLPPIVRVLNPLVAFAGVTLLFALIYKVLPDRKVGWGDVWLGALITSLLFNVGKYGLALYLARGSVASAYGAAGSFAALLVWIYYSSMIFFLGAEFTKVWARDRAGSHHRPYPPPAKEARPEGYT